MKTQVRRETKWSAACKLNWIQFNWIQLKWNYVWCEGKLIIDTRLKIQISYIFGGVQRMNKRWKDDEETKRNEKRRKKNKLRLIAKKKASGVDVMKNHHFSGLCFIFVFDYSWVSHAVRLVSIRMRRVRKLE